MTDIVVDRLRIRGREGRRLAMVAARALPGALERALADLADVDLGRLTVRLSDAADHDDATLAVLWADGIRHAALAAGARVRSGRAGGAGRDAPSGGSDGPATASGAGVGPAHAADVDEITTAIAGWLAAGAASLPPEVAALSDPQIATAVLRRIGTERAASLALVLAEAASQLRTTRDTPGTRAGEPVGPFDHPHLDHPFHGRPNGTAPGAGSQSPASETPPPALAARVAAEARALRPLLEWHRGAAVDLTSVTRAAGVVLVYPWLADLCREAADLHTDAEPSHARRVALAALADPEDLDLVDDPLVRFLAGAPENATPAAGLAPLDAHDEVRAAAEGILRRFVALLPGFERSSAEFIRDSWVRRTGVLDVGHDPAQLFARTAPLDVVLPLLPYPVGVMRLPWTPTLTVQFRP